MTAAPHEVLTPWAPYYEITGAAAAALTGLQFVAVTLMAQSSVPGTGGDGAEHTMAAFGTPTVVHFAAALLLSAGLSAPWPSFVALRLTLAAAGIVGLAYAGVVLRRARRQTRYAPVLEDWVWHVALPTLAYGGIAGSAAFARDPGVVLFGVAGMTLVLLCVGIHNAWDTVAYMAAQVETPTAASPPPASLPPGPATASPEPPRQRRRPARR